MQKKKDNLQKSEKEVLEERLTELLAVNRESVVISIKGSWGIGKSHFWHKFSEKLIKGKYAYVSLFGKTSLDDIKKDIIFQISKSSKTIKAIQEKIGSTKYLGIDVASMLSILSKTDFENITICFDDLERVSREIDIKDIIGLISELKEQKKCNVVIINNIDQLEDADALNDNRIFKKSQERGKDVKVETKYFISNSNNKQAFELYSEKIIDYSFTYSPTIRENFSILRDEITFFDPDLILNFLESTNNNDKILKNFNIRILKKLTQALNLFSFLSDHKIDKVIKDNIAAYIFEKVYDKQIELYDFDQINISSIRNHIDSALEKSFLLELEDFLERIQGIQNNLKTRETHDKVKELYERHNFDLQYKTSDFASELFSLLKSSEDSIIKILSFETLTFYVDLISSIEPTKKDELEIFLRDSSHKFIDSLFTKEEAIQTILHDDYENTFAKYPDILAYFTKMKKQYEDQIIGDYTSTLELLKEIMEKSGWSSKVEEIICSVPTASHKAFMIRSKEYLETAFQFARWANSFTGKKPFSLACNKILDAMKQLSAENADYEMKLSKIINILEPKVESK